MLNVTHKAFMLSVVMLSIVILNGIMPRVLESGNWDLSHFVPKSYITLDIEKESQNQISFSVFVPTAYSMLTKSHL